MTRLHLRFFGNTGLQQFFGPRRANVLLLAILALVGGLRAANAASAKPALSGKSADQLPLVFEQNNGQTDADALFLTRIAGAKVFLMNDGFVLRAAGKSASPIRLRFSGEQTPTKPHG